jgi:hypothetical protein
MLRAFWTVVMTVTYISLNLSESHKKDPLTTPSPAEVAFMISTGSCGLFAVIGATKLVVNFCFMLVISTLVLTFIFDLIHPISNSVGSILVDAYQLSLMD